MKKALLFIVYIPLLTVGCQRINVKPNPVPEPIACTQEAKLCPDGSYVGRTGPNCEFAACPEAPTPSSGINGYIHTGPTCPVQRIPPDASCADKPFTNATIIATSTDGKQYQGQTDTIGKFRLIVPAGTYTIQVITVNILPRCEETEVEVTTNTFASVDISCDTGIR